MSNIGIRNEKFISFTENILAHNKISHAYIIELCDYDIDMSLVSRFIKLLLCKNDIKTFDKLNCGSCNVCNLIDNHNYPDIRYIEPDGKEIKKNQLLDLQKNFNNKSLLENKRIYVIQEADKLNVAAANTLLKFLEEPADDIIAILLTKNRYKLLDTILSRCQVLTIGSEDDSYDYNEEINTIISYIVKGDSLFINYGSLLELLPDKNIAMDYFKKIEIIFLDFLQNNKSLYSCLSGVNKDTIIRFLNIIEIELMKLDYNVNYKLWLDSLFSKLIGGVSND